MCVKLEMEYKYIRACSQNFMYAYKKNVLIIGIVKLENCQMCFLKKGISSIII